MDRMTESAQRTLVDGIEALARLFASLPPPRRGQSSGSAALVLFR
jgi:hypothetical protein